MLLKNQLENRQIWEELYERGGFFPVKCLPGLVKRIQQEKDFLVKLYKTNINIPCNSSIKGNLCLAHLDNIGRLALVKVDLNAGQ